MRRRECKWPNELRDSSSFDSARHMQDSVGFCRFLLQYIDGLLCRKNEQVNLSTLGFELHFLHDRQSTATRADHQPPAFPRYFLLDGQWCVAKKIAESFGSLFLAFAYLAAVDHHVMLVANPVDPNQAKGKPFEVHMCLYAYDNGSGQRQHPPHSPAFPGRAVHTKCSTSLKPAIARRSCSTCAGTSGA